MSDVSGAAPAAAPAATPAVAPVAAPVAAPVVAPVTTSVTAPAVVPPAAPTPAAAPDPAVPATPAAPEPSLLGTEEKPVEAVPSAPAEAAPAKEGEKPAETEAKPAEAEPAPITYEPFTLPEGITLDPERVGAFTEALGKHHAPQELGQELIGMYLDEVKRFENTQRDVWVRTRTEWRDEVQADPALGGNRMQTTLQSCSSIISQYGTPELRKMLTMTGAGDHIEMVRFVNRVAQALGEGKPIPAAKPAPQAPPSRSQRRYLPPETQ